MIQHYIVGIGSLLLLSAGWLLVQRAWKKSFADLADQPDALAGRSRCHGCSDAEACGAQEKTP